MEKKETLTMENVAERAGVSRATIYRYYTNIDSISMDLILQLDVPKPDRFLAMTRKHQKMVPF
nr:helix-turn-helix domain-containing protein [uncultured Allomuricauda sp.]